MWLKFKKQYEKGEKGKNDHVLIEKDKVVEIKDEDLAKSLIKLDYAEESKKPEGDEDLQKLLKTFTETMENGLENCVKSAIGSLETSMKKNFENITFIEKEDKEGLRGFKDEGHFLKCVLEVQRAAKDGVAPDSAVVGGKEYFDLLVKTPSGQNVSNDNDGGFLVPEVMQNKIWSNMEENPQSFLSMTDRNETSGNSTKIPVMEEVSRKSGYGKRHAGIAVYWMDEAGQFTASKAKVTRRSLDLNKMGALVYFTEEQLDDAPATWNNRIKRLVPEAIMWEANYSILYGSGVGQPLGIMRHDPLIVIPASKRDGSAQSNHTLLHWNLSQMYWRNINRENAIWIVHPDVAQQMEFMYFDDDSTNKRPVYSPINRGVTTSGSQLFVGPYGRPMLVHEMAQDLGGRGDIQFHDFSAYSSLTKVGGGIKTASSIHVRFLYEEIAFRFSYRLGGRSFWSAPKEDLHGDTTRGPFMALASRTGGSTSSGL